MTPETVDKLATAIDSAFTRLGKGSNDPVGEVIVFLEWLLNILRRFDSKERIRRDLQQLEEPTAQVVSLIEGTLRHSPRLAGDWVRSKTKEALMGMRGSVQGRPDAVPTEQRGQICDEIALLERKGHPLPRAKKLLARKLGVHERTVERIWTDRSKYPSEQGITFVQAQEFLKTIF